MLRLRSARASPCSVQSRMYAPTFKAPRPHRRIPDLLGHGECLGPAASGRGEVVAVHRHMGRTPQNPGANGRGGLLRRQRPGQPPAALLQMAPQLPEQWEGCDQPEGEIVRAGGIEPLQRRPEVVVFTFQPGEPGGAPPARGLRLGSLRQGDEECRMVVAGRLRLACLHQPLRGVDPDGLPGVRTGPLRRHCDAPGRVSGPRAWPAGRALGRRRVDRRCTPARQPPA